MPRRSTTVPAALAVVIPTYNRARIVRRAIASVLRSPREDIELVVVDDGSSDETPAVVSDVVDRRLRTIRLAQRSNANAARNAGIAATTAPVIAFLDSDDEFLPGRCERLIALFESETEIDAALDSFVVGGTPEPQFARQPTVRSSGAALTRLLVSHSIPLTNSAIAVRRSALEAAGLFDPSFARHQDRDLLLRLAHRHCVALGTGFDVVKNQSKDSFSRSLDNYIKSLDHLVDRHPVFAAPENADILAYLTIRGIVAALVRGRLFSAAREMSALSAATHLPRDLRASMSRYREGKRQRQRIRQSILPAVVPGAAPAG